MNAGEIVRLMEGAWSNYRSIRLEVRNRFDRAAYERGLERFTASPFIPDLLRTFRERKEPPGVEFRGFRAWLVKPAYHRQENYPDAELRSMASISGGDGEQLWSYVPGEARVFIQPNRALAVLSRSEVRPARCTDEPRTPKPTGTSGHCSGRRSES